MERKKYVNLCCKEYIESTNIDTIDFSDQKKKKETWEKIDSFEENSFIYFSKSILCGEYIYSETFDDDIKTFLKDLSIEYPTNISADKKDILNYIHDINKSLSNSIRELQSVQIYAKQKFDTKDNKNFFGSYNTYTSTRPSRLDDFVNLCIPVCIFDYRFPSNDDKFQDLFNIKIDIENKIKKISNKDLLNIYNILLYKCHFIIKRIKKEPFFYSLDFETEEVNPDSLEISNLNYFSELIDISHVEQNKVNKWKEDIDSNSKNDLAPYILLMRHYKNTLKDKRDVEKMDVLIRKFDKIYNSAVRKFSESKSKNLLDEHDKFSWDTVQNFLYNCRFSFLATHGELQLKELKKEISGITELHSQTKVKNFHPFEKAIESIIRCLESHLEKGDYNENLIENKFNEFDSLLKKYEDSIEWSRSHKFFPFQLPFAESRVEINEIKVYCPSTFAKYIDYKEQDDYLNESKLKKENLRLRFELLQERLTIDNARIEIESVQKRNFEILAIFTAIITFIFGSVNIFVANKDTSFLSILTNSSALGIVLISFFGLLIFVSPFITRKIKYRELLKFYKLRFIAVSFFFLFWGLLFYFKFPLINKINAHEKQKKDTVYIQTDKTQIKNEQPVSINIRQ